MELKKALFIAQELAPYVASTPLSTFSRMLPQGLQESGIEVRTFMPRYSVINERRNQLHEVIRLSGLNIEIDDTDHPLIIKVATLLPSRMQVYFIDCDDYFERHSVEGLEINIAPAENDERAIFFARGVLETVKKLKWAPAVVHCIGWMSTLAPMFLRKKFADDPTFIDSKIVVSLFDDAFEGPLDQRLYDKLLMDGFDPDQIAVLRDSPDHTALYRLAMDYADAVAISSPVVNPELVDYARLSGKPVLEYPGDENYVQAYKEFYLSLQ